MDKRLVWLLILPLLLCFILDWQLHTFFTVALLGALLLATLFFLFALLPRRNHPKWMLLRRYRYAHRGLHYSSGPPENSLSAFRQAVERGYGAELDVHLTRDKRLAVIHDSSLKRVCGVAGTVESLTAAELSRLSLSGTSERIPFLEEVLPLFANHTPLIVEIKTVRGNAAELTEKVMQCLDRFPVDYAMESFDPRVLFWLRRHRPEIVRGQLAKNFREIPLGLNRVICFVLTNLLCNIGTRPDFIAYQFEDRLDLAPRLCCDWIGGQEINWTIRSPADMAMAEREGHLVIFEGFTPKKGGVTQDEPRESGENMAEENVSAGPSHGAAGA